MGKKDYFCIALFLFFLTLISPPWAKARFINLSGSLDLSYGEFKTEQTNGETLETSTFQQRYHLRNFGDIFNPRIGTVLLSSTYLSQDTDTDNQSDQTFEFTDYSAALNLLPRLFPLSLYYQRVNRSNRFENPSDPGDLKNRDRLTTMGLNLSLSAQRLPRISLSYNQSEIEAIDDADRLPNTINRFFNLESSGRLGETTLIGRYQFNETDVARPIVSGQSVGKVEPIRGDAFNLTTESRLAPALVCNTNLRLSKNGGGNSTGVTFSQENGIGGSCFYTPSVHWDTHVRIDYSETPGSSSATTSGKPLDLTRSNFFWSASYRPTEILDMVMSARYYRFDFSSQKTNSPFFDYTINYRPFFGLSSGLGVQYGESETDGAITSLDSSYKRYRGFLNYSRAVEVLRFSSSYALAIGETDTDQQDKAKNTSSSSREKDLMNTITLGVENTRIRYIHVALRYTFNDIQRSNDRSVVKVPDDQGNNQEIGDQRSNLFQINADTSYFRGLIFQDDSLTLQSTASWTEIDGFGVDGTTFLVDIRGTYYFMRGGVLSSGWTHQEYPGGFYLNSDIFYEAFQLTFYIGDTSFTFGARANQERTDGDSSFDRDTIETNGSIIYRIGKFMFSIDGRWSEDRSKVVSQQDVTYETQSIFARMSRSF